MNRYIFIIIAIIFNVVVLLTTDSFWILFWSGFFSTLLVIRIEKTIKDAYDHQ